jgi:hypothetical protein
MHPARISSSASETAIDGSPHVDIVDAAHEAFGQDFAWFTLWLLNIAMEITIFNGQLWNITIFNGKL